MQTPYYELHVTVDCALYNNRACMLHVLSRYPDWKYSNISDDIQLGLGPKQYATANFPTDIKISGATKELDMMVATLQATGLTVLRSKIECVVLDRRHPLNSSSQTEELIDEIEISNAGC